MFVGDERSQWFALHTVTMSIVCYTESPGKHLHECFHLKALHCTGTDWLAVSLSRIIWHHYPVSDPELLCCCWPSNGSGAKLAEMLECKIFMRKMLILNLMHWLAHYIRRRDFFLIGNPEEELWKSSFVKKIHSAVPCKGGGQNMPDFCWYSTLLLELGSLSRDFLMNSIQVIRLWNTILNNPAGSLIELP